MGMRALDGRLGRAAGRHRRLRLSPGGGREAGAGAALDFRGRRRGLTRRREGKASAATSASSAIVREGLCTAPADHRALASRVSADIRAGPAAAATARRRSPSYDRVTGLSCIDNGSEALRLGQHREGDHPRRADALAPGDEDVAVPVGEERGHADDRAVRQRRGDRPVGRAGDENRLQHFLNLAGMGETELGQDGEWGLTQVTAHDEMLLLKLLTASNSVLDAGSRGYELYLMAHVTGWAAWASRPARRPT